MPRQTTYATPAIFSTVGRRLSALDSAGAGPVWLNVNESNPAGELYSSLGFKQYGVRGRWS